MRRSGHKSRGVLDRYKIVSESDLADAALKVECGAKAELSQAEIHSSHIEPAQNEVSSDNENARSLYKSELAADARVAETHGLQENKAS